VGFGGTPAFAARALAAIHEHGATIPLVLTRPDRPYGRGLALAASAVKLYAAQQGLRVEQPANLRQEGAVAALRGIPLDVLVVAAYGLILPQTVLDWPRYGCLNIHASLLPRWRGAAPVARAIDAGDATTGVSIMQMDAGLDTGPVIRAARLDIGPRETAGSLTERLADLGARTIVETLTALAREGKLSAAPQSDGQATYANKIGRADELVDWARDAVTLDRRIRALAPSPGALAAWRGKPVKVRVAEPVRRSTDAQVGTVVGIGAQGIDVACGDGTVLRITELQPAGGKSMPARAFVAGYRVAPGERFEAGR
jgi:methionyl-tRNA formyltransferase